MGGDNNIPSESDGVIGDLVHDANNSNPADFLNPLELGGGGDGTEEEPATEGGTGGTEIGEDYDTTADVEQVQKENELVLNRFVQEHLDTHPLFALVEWDVYRTVSYKPIRDYSNESAEDYEDLVAQEWEEYSSMAGVPTDYRDDLLIWEQEQKHVTGEETGDKYTVISYDDHGTPQLTSEESLLQVDIALREASRANDQFYQYYTGNIILDPNSSADEPSYIYEEREDKEDQKNRPHDYFETDAHPIPGSGKNDTKYALHQGLIDDDGEGGEWCGALQRFIESEAGIPDNQHIAQLATRDFFLHARTIEEEIADKGLQPGEYLTTSQQTDLVVEPLSGYQPLTNDYAVWYTDNDENDVSDSGTNSHIARVIYSDDEYMYLLEGNVGDRVVLTQRPYQDVPDLHFIKNNSGEMFIPNGDYDFQTIDSLTPPEDED